MDYPPQLLTSGAVRTSVPVFGDDGTMGDTVVDLFPGEEGYAEALAAWHLGTTRGWNDGQAQDLPPLR